MPFKSDKQRRYLWSQKPEVAKQIAYKQDGGGVYSAGLSDSAAKWWNERMAGIPQHRGYADDPDDITEMIGQNPDDRITYNNPGLINPNVKRPMHYVDMATYYTPGERAMGRDEMQQAKMAEANRRLREEAKRRGFVNEDGSLNFNSGGDVPMMGMKPKKVTQKDRYGNQVSVEFEPEVKPLDQTAIVKQMMEEVPMPMDMSIMDHPGEPRGTDTVPAWLTPGEFVVNAEAMSIPENAEMVEQINNQGRAMQAAKGGNVPFIASPMLTEPQYRAEGGWWSDLKKLMGGGYEDGDIETIIPPMAEEPVQREMPGVMPMSPEEALLRAREGERRDVYIDSRGYPTVGIGHRLPDRFADRVGQEFSQDQIDRWFADDRETARADARDNVGEETWKKLNRRQKDAMTSMAFQLGKGKQKEFDKMLTAMRDGDWEGVRREAKDSNWYKQTPKRVEDVVAAFRAAGGNIPSVPEMESDIIPVHSGGLDRHGGHRDRQRGGYHYHRSQSTPTPKPKGRSVFDKIAGAVGSGAETIWDEATGKAADERERKAKHKAAKQESIASGNEPWVQQHWVDKLANTRGVIDADEYPYLKDMTADQLREMYNERIKSGSLDPDDMYSVMDRITRYHEYKASGGPIYAFAGVDTSDPMTFMGDEWAQPIIDREVAAAAPQGNYAEVPMTDEIPDVDADMSSGWTPPAMAMPDESSAEIPEGGEDFWSGIADWAMDTSVADERNASFNVKAAENNLAAAEETVAELEARVDAGEPVNEKTLDGARAAVAHQEEKLAENKHKLEGEIVDDLVEQNVPGVEDDLETLEIAASDPEGEAADNPSKESEKGVQSTPEVIAEGEAAAKKDPSLVKKAEGFFKGAFSDLFDGKELARMAIMYVGSRALGYSHHGSLNWAAKNYLTRIDAKADQKQTMKKELLKANKYTPASVQQYIDSGDASVLQTVGVAANPLGNFKTFYDKNGKKVRAQEYKVGDGKVWKTDDGRAVDTSFTEDASLSPGTQEYSDRVRTDSGTYTDMLKGMRSQFGTSRGKEGEVFYATDLVPETQGTKIAKWALDHRVPPEMMGTIVENAYHSAVEHSKATGEKVRDITGYLNEQYVAVSTGSPDLFKDKSGKTLDGGKVSKLVNAISSRTGASNTQTIEFFRTKWNALDEDVREQYDRSAAKGENGFYKYMTDNLYKYDLNNLG